MNADHPAAQFQKSKRRVSGCGCGRALATLIFLCSVTACGVGTTRVVQPFEQTYRTSSLDLVEGASWVNVPPQVRSDFERHLQASLYGEDDPFKRGRDLKIVYRFVEFQPGNQFARWFLKGFGNAGEGSLTIEARYVNAAGEDVGSILAGGKISSGIFGGFYDWAVQKAAGEIADYTRQNFR